MQVTVSPTISTDAIAGSPFCVTSADAAAVSVSFTSSGIFSGNTYTAQLSNATGSFASPITIGTLTSDANSGTINGTIPAGTVTGTGYRMRVISSGPPALITDNGSNLTINLGANSITPNAIQNINVGVNGAILTVTENPSALSREWFYGTTSGGPYTTNTGVTATTYTPNFVTQGTYYIVCVSTIPCGTITTSQVRINVAATNTTGAISGSPFCAGTTVSVPFTSAGTFSGNTYTAQLSSAGGSFTSPTTIGTLASDANSGTISAIIPVAASGTGYRIRVISNSPSTIGTDNGSNLTANPLPANKTLLAGSSSVCTGTGTNIIVALPTATTTTYQLRNNADNSIIGSPVIGAGISINLPTGNLTSNTTFNVLATITATGCTAQMTGTQTVTVNPIIADNTVSSIQTICSGTTPAALSGSTPTGGSGSYNYNWEQSTDGSTFGNAGGTRTGINYTPGSLTQTTWYRRTVTSGGCTDSSVAIMITVNPLPAIVTVSGGGTVCNSTTLTASNGGDGVLYFQGTASGGTSTATPSTSQLISTAGTYYFRALAANGCWGPPGSTAVIINFSPTTTGVSICQGGSGSLTSSTTCTSGSPTSTAATNAGTGTNVTGIGSSVWTSLANITSPIGSPYVTQTVPSNGTTNYLQGTNYGFAVPISATINGITVVIRRQATGSNSISDNSVKLVKAGVVVGTSLSTGAQWSQGSFSNATYGSVSTLWGTTWTAAEINASNFGVALSATSGSGTPRQLDVDYMQITVTYTIPGSLNWYTVSSGGSSIGSGSSFNPVGVPGSPLANTNTAGTTVFYAECSTVPGCRTATNFVVNPALTAPTASDKIVCSDGTTTQTLTATATLTQADIDAGATITWWDSVASGTQVSPTKTGPGAVTYYAQATSGSCSSPTRTPVRLAILPILADVTACSSYTVPELSPYTYYTDGFGNYWNQGDVITTTQTIYPIGETSDYTPVTCTPNHFTVTITSPSATIAHTNVSCFGDSDGSATVTATGGTGTLTYAIDDGLYQTGNVFSGLGAGTYTLSVKDANGCSATVDVTITEPAVALSATAGNQIDVSCFGGNDGSVVITAAGGTAGYTITPSQTGLTAGLTTFTVTDANGCSTTVDVTITEPAVALSATAGNQIDVSCFGGNDGSVVITAAGGTAGYTITPSQTGLTAGLTTFTVTDANGCSTTVDVTITEPAVALSATAGNQIDVSCFGGNDGSVVITAAGGTAGYTITPSQTGLTAGLTTFTVTDANGCSTTVDVTITEPAVALSATAGNQIDVSCFGGNDGSVVITAAGGTAGYTITPSQTGLTAGLTTFTVTDANGCSTTVDVTITEPAVALSATAGNQIDVSCFGGNDGSVVITAAGGTAGYTITPSQTGLTAGLTTFTVTDANGCSTTVDVTITEPAVALSATAGNQIDVSCFGGNDGSVVITAAGGTAGYTITPSQTGLTAGLTTFTVTDANGCSTTVDVTITEPAVALSATAGNQIDVSCFGGNDGSVVITAAGGTAGYTITPSQTGLTAGLTTFTVTDANGCSTTVDVTITEPAVALSATAGNQIDVSCFGGNDGSVVITAAGGTAGYTITPSQTGLTAGLTTFTVTDAKGCSTTVDVTITEPAVALSAMAGNQIDVSCFGGNDGSVVITAAGGTAGYTITPSQTGLTAGLTTFTVTDANGCSTTVDVTITEPAVALSATAGNQIDVSCFGGNDGSVVITAAGGTAGYTITPSQTGLTAGLTTFTVTDANGCSTTVDVTITEPAVALSATAGNQIDVSCFGGNDGSVVITAAGGTAGYTITPSQTGLTAGLTTFTVTDANGCSTTVDVTITEPAVALSATAGNQIDVSCFGGNDGSVVITAAGGTAGYTITPSQTGLTAGLTTFTVTDAKGCETTVDVTITEPAVALSATAGNQIDVSCFGGNDGSVVITAAGGTAGYTITPSQTGLTAGLTTFTVTDAKGCETTVDVTITEPAVALSATAGNQIDVSCFGGNDGSVVITAAGGTAGYTITPSQTGLTAGLTTFTVTDANGCSTTVDVTITEPAVALSATAGNQIDVSCFGGNDGSVVITAAGGTAGYTITPSQTGLTAGLTTFTVTDANGCSTTVDVTITEPAVALSATAGNQIDVSCFGGNDGSVVITAAGGTAGYTITPSQTGLTAGLTTFTVTDANGCSTTVDVTITEPAVALSATAGNQIDVSCFGGNDGSVVITAAGGTAGYTITPSQTGLTAGLTTFTVTDANGCSTTVDVTITEPAVALSATAGNQIDVSCFGGNDGSVVITAAGGTAGYTITPSQTGLTAGLTTFTVTDANGCSTTVDVTITEPAVALSATAGNQIDVSCFGGNDGSVVITAAGGTAGYTITPSQTGLTAGLTTFTVTDANGCSTTVDVTITEPAVALSATAGNQIDVSCFGGNDGSVVITAAGGTAGYTITPSQTGLTAGLTTFTVTDANGCSTTVDVTITEPAVALSATAGNQIDVSCFGGNDGSVVITAAGGTAGYTITPSQTGLTAGLTTFTVTDANGCSTTVDVTITEPAVALSATLAIK